MIQNTVLVWLKTDKDRLEMLSILVQEGFTYPSGEALDDTMAPKSPFPWAIDLLNKNMAFCSAMVMPHLVKKYGEPIGLSEFKARYLREE